MASSPGTPFKAMAFFGAILALVGASQVSLYKLILNTFTGPGSYSRMFATALILANLKNFPLVWHVRLSHSFFRILPGFRVWGAILKHFLVTRKEFTPQTGGPAALFQPTISSSRSPVTECDYNLHKSNSTYFSDLDVTRSHAVSALLRRGMQALQHNDKTKIVRHPQTGEVVKGKMYIMLGAVQCNFKREIKPYEGYEMWTRLLCWDRKWIYVVTHFVKKGVVKPDGYTLTSGGWFGKPVLPKKKGTQEEEDDKKMTEEIKREIRKPDSEAVFATAIGKYVFKLGRLTIHPEVVLHASGLLPSKPGGWNLMDGSVKSEPTKKELEADEKMREELKGAGQDAWDWKRIEEEKEKGLQYAEHFAALESLQETFTGSERPAVGKYRDLFWA